MSSFDGRDTSQSALSIRPARESDVGAIDALVRELAVYEREPDAVVASVDDFRAALFAEVPLVHCLVAEVQNEPDPPQLAGIALWFVSFSTWRGRHGIWLEDLYVSPRWRGRGAGRALLAHLARICVDRGYARMEWNVLDWNEPALGFYRGLGAEGLDTWTVHRLADGALTRLAADASGDGLGHGAGRA